MSRPGFLAERAGSPPYVLHMAAGSGVEALAEGRARAICAHLLRDQRFLWICAGSGAAIAVGRGSPGLST
jgi:hypothetical protein